MAAAVCAVWLPARSCISTSRFQPAVLSTREFGRGGTTLTFWRRDLDVLQQVLWADAGWSGLGQLTDRDGIIIRCGLRCVECLWGGQLLRGRGVDGRSRAAAIRLFTSTWVQEGDSSLARASMSAIEKSMASHKVVGPASAASRVEPAALRVLVPNATARHAEPAGGGR